MISINPAINENTGVYQIKVKLTDSMTAERTYSFKIEVKSENDEEVADS